MVWMLLYSVGQTRIYPGGTLTDSVETETEIQCLGDNSERRGTCRAMLYWAELYESGGLPDVDTINIDDIPEMADNMFVLRLTRDPVDCAFVYSGSLVDAFCGINPLGQSAKNVFPDTLGERLPYAGEALMQFKNPLAINERVFFNGHYILCRLMLLPLSDDGESVDHVLGALTYRRISGN